VSSPRLKQQTDDVSTYTKPPTARLSWVTKLDAAECRYEHPMVFTIEKIIIEHQAKRHEVVRLYGFCDTCLKRRGERTYQVGFYDRSEVRWYAIPSLAQYEKMQGLDGRTTEEQTQLILETAWNNPNEAV